jgi:hypothetical protein
MNNIIRKIKERFGWGWKKNYGFKGTGRTMNDWKMGGETGIVPEVLQESGQWDYYLPAFENQATYFETFRCVTFSMFHCWQIILKRKYNEIWDFSERLAATLNGTTREGNSMYWVAECARKIYGFVSWLKWPNDEGKTWEEEYKPIPQNLIDLAKANLSELKINYEWVEPCSPNNLKQALKYSPLQIAIYAFGPKVNGVYQRIDGHMPNHCVTLYGWDEKGNWKIFDHYLGNEKRLLAPDYIIGYGMKYSITKI